MSFLRKKSQPPGVYFLSNRGEWTYTGVDWREGLLIKNVLDQVCELPTIRLVPVVRPLFALCDSKTGHALLTNSRVTAGQARRAYHLRVFVNAGENSRDLSKYCTAAKNYYFLQLQTDFTQGKFLNQITLVTAFRLSAIGMVHHAMETKSTYKQLRPHLGDFMPGYLKERVKGREGEETLEQHYDRYMELFRSKSPDILKGQYLYMYEQDPSCGQHSFQVNQLVNPATRDVAKVTLKVSAKEGIRSSRGPEYFPLQECSKLVVNLATHMVQLDNKKKTYVFPSSDAVLSFASIVDSYWKLKVDINSSPLEGGDLITQECVLSTAGRVPHTDRREVLHGPISEESTQQVFLNHGMGDGLFLLRESRSRDSTFILSLCHENQVKHYKVHKDPDRGFCLVDQTNDECPEDKEHKKYHISLHLLISNHNHVKDGLPVILKTNCSPSVTGPIPLFPSPVQADGDEPEEISPIVQRFQQAGVRYIKFDQLRITRELGSGHFSNVHEAEWKDGDKEEVKVAIKIPTMKADQAAAVIKEMEKEVLTMFKLEHLNIVSLLGVTDAKHFLAQIGHFPMIVMEFIKGGSLSSMLERQKASLELKVQAPRQLEIMYLTFGHQIAEAMGYLVTKNVVHRDLATRNVLVISDSHVKISDFGLARQCIDDKDYYRSSETQDIPVFWYAPECLEKLIFSHTSDVWSFGVTLWEIFTIGHKPQQFLPQIHKRPGQTLKDACNPLVAHYKRAGPNKLPRLATCSAKVYDNIIKKCWNFDPSTRPTFDALNELIKQQLSELNSTDV